MHILLDSNFYVFHTNFVFLYVLESMEFLGEEKLNTFPFGVELYSHILLMGRRPQISQMLSRDVKNSGRSITDRKELGKFSQT